MHVCTYMCIYLFVYVYVYAYMYIYMYICIAHPRLVGVSCFAGASQSPAATGASTTLYICV